MIVNVTASGSGCKLFLAQGSYPENSSTDWDWFYEAVVDAWPKVLDGLKKFPEEKFAR